MLDAGRLVGQGTHAQLLANDGLYASLWNRQRQAEKAREELAEALAAEGRRTEGRLVPTDTVLTIAPAERDDTPEPPDRMPSA